MRQKGFSPIWILVLVLIGIVSVYILGGRNRETLTTYETANWKTYTNSQYGYWIKYPSDWGVREFPDTREGAGFRPKDAPNDPAYEVIGIRIADKSLDAVAMPFVDYVKIAAVKEIQNYESLNSIEAIKTFSGMIGYKTTWKVIPLGSNSSEISLPITYFDSTDGKKTIQVSISDKKYEQAYNDMILTVHLDYEKKAKH